MLRHIIVIMSIVLLIMCVPLAFSATKFVEIDDKTGGDWVKKYGADGYIFCNTNGPQGVAVVGADAVKKNDIAKLPNYIDSYKLGGGIQGYVWQIGDKKPKIVVTPDGVQNAACWFNGGDYTVDLPLKRQTIYTLAVYIDDWENGGRKQSLTLKDLKTGADLATKDFEQYGTIGKYGVFQVDTSVQLFVHYIPSYANAVVSAVFFHGGSLAVVNSGEKLSTTWGKVKSFE